MRTERVKNILRLGLSGVAAAIVFVMILGGVIAMVRASTGASVADAFSETAVVPAELAGQVTWLPDTRALPREVEPSTRESIEGAWVRALSVVSSIPTGPLELRTQAEETTWFSGRALRQFDSLANEQWQPISFSDHELAVDFYSADGQIMTLEAEMTATTTIDDPAGETEPSVTIAQRETMTAVLILQDGNWRIEHLVRDRSAAAELAKLLVNAT